MLYVEWVSGQSGVAPYDTSRSSQPRRDVLARLQAVGLITIKVKHNPHARKVDRVQWFPSLTSVGRQYLNERRPQ